MDGPTETADEMEKERAPFLILLKVRMGSNQQRERSVFRFHLNASQSSGEHHQMIRQRAKVLFPRSKMKSILYS